MSQLRIKREGIIALIGDLLMLPLMYILQGNVREVPQRTHRWNNQKLSASALRHLKADAMVHTTADRTALRRWWGPLPIFHMPILGGWKRFIVIAPKVPQDVWYIGWVVGDTAGLSNIKLRGSVRLLHGPSTADFFGVNEHGEQIEVVSIGDGMIGKAGQYRKVPLL
jgi:hypothetical protein